MPFEVSIGRADVLAQLRVELHDVAVGIDDPVIGHGLFLRSFVPDARRCAVRDACRTLQV